jgi:NitT/TauT family transport system ATP-binding protein
LLRIREHERKTVVFVTHSISEAIFLADRIVVMADPAGLDQTGDRRRARARDPEFVGLERRIKELVRKEVIKLGVV